MAETNVVENDSAIRATVQKFKIFILNNMLQMIFNEYI